MQGTANFHHQIADTRLPQAAGVVDDAAALDAAVDVLDAHTSAGDALIRGFLCPREGPAPGLPRRHDDLNVVEGEGQAAEILEQPAPRGQRVWCRIGNPFIVSAARVRVAQEEDREDGIDEQHIFHRMACFLATITARLLKRVLGALDAPFRPIVANRGEEAGLGATVGDGSTVGTTRPAASASVTPIRWASSCKDRLGASPRARRVACSTTSRT